MIAPGAEEFVASETPGPWLPPERTFAPLGAPSATSAFSVERARSLDLLIEHDLDESYAVGVRRFYQDVDNQLVTLFGLNVPGGPQSVGHYYVANAGSLGADGWGVRLTSTGKRVKGTVDYSLTRARWVEGGDATAVASWAPAAIRYANEDLHDISTSVATDIPETSTRVFVFYKINTGYATLRYVAHSSGARRPVRRPDQPGAAVRARRHPLGSASRPAKPFPRPERSRLGLRRAPRCSSAKARRRRLPRSLLIHTRRKQWRCSRLDSQAPARRVFVDPPFFADFFAAGFLDRVSGLLETRLRSGREVIARQ